jgi:hypothetical protein
MVVLEMWEMHPEGIGSAAKLKSARRGEARKVFGMRVATSCDRGQDRWRTELDLGSR